MPLSRYRDDVLIAGDLHNQQNLTRHGSSPQRRQGFGRGDQNVERSASVSMRFSPSFSVDLLIRVSFTRTAIR